MSLIKIKMAINSGDFIKAIHLLNKAVEVEPENGFIWNLRGDMIQSADSLEGPPLEEAEKSYLNAIQLNPNDLMALESLANYYDAVEDNLAKAMTYAERYLQIAEPICARMRDIRVATSYPNESSPGKE